MKFRFDIFFLGVILLFAACTPTRKTATSSQKTEAAISRLTPPPADYPADRLASYYYLQGVRLGGIYDDLPAAKAAFDTALAHDSLHAPSYYELSTLHFNHPEKALAYSLRANELEPDNIWFKQQLGRIYIVSGAYEPARKVYDEIVQLTPNNPDNYRYLAALYEETGYPFAAITLLDSAELRFGFIEELNSYKRQLMISTGMIDRAISETVILTHNSPYDEQNFVILGDLYTRNNNDSLALEAYHQALDIDPNSVEALTSLSEYYRSKNDMRNFLSTTKRLFESDAIPLEMKITFFNDVIKNAQFYQQQYFAVNELVATLAIKYPGNYSVAELYAEHQINSGDLEGALQTYKSALSESSPMELYKTILEIEAYLQRNDSVKVYADLALARFPGEIDLYFSKGYGEYFMKEYNEAIRTLNDAVKYAPTDSLTSVLYSSMGEIAHAKDSLSGDYVKYFERALKYDPENLHALFSYSNYLVERGKNPEKALKNLQNDSLKSIMLGTIGDLIHTSDTVGGKQQAYPYYEKAIRLDPNNIHALNNYSYYLSLEDRDLEKALAMIGRVMELEPGNPTYIDTYGWILYKMGRFEEAKKAMRQAVTFDAGASKELLIHYGDILYELKEYFMASVYWKKALEKGYEPEEIERRMKSIEGK